MTATRMVARLGVGAVLGLLLSCGSDDRRGDTRDAALVAADLTPPPEAAAGRPLDIPSDARARYWVLGVAGTPERPIITTLRVGSSGTTYSRRLYDCAARTVMYLGTGDTMEEAMLSRPDPGMAPIVPEAIADYVGRVACDPTHAAHLEVPDSST